MKRTVLLSLLLICTATAGSVEMGQQELQSTNHPFDC